MTIAHYTLKSPPIRPDRSAPATTEIQARYGKSGIIDWSERAFEVNGQRVGVDQMRARKDGSLFVRCWEEPGARDGVVWEVEFREETRSWKVYSTAVPVPTNLIVTAKDDSILEIREYAPCISAHLRAFSRTQPRPSLPPTPTRLNKHQWDEVTYMDPNDQDTSQIHRVDIEDISLFPLMVLIYSEVTEHPSAAQTGRMGTGHGSPFQSLLQVPMWDTW
ncbi:hypothetical protein BD779DRAFT_1716710 [Infundibulicybe gibba]|nr:hypothetical protein BD779DRAFT_1716710 [Infundibulicybe gibba]